MTTRRQLLGASAGLLVAPGLLRAADTTGITDSEIRIGNTMPYSGPASAYGSIGRSHQAQDQLHHLG